MENNPNKNLIKTGLLEDKRIFTTNTLYKRFLRPRKNQFDHKPEGLWYSIGSSWLEWCIGEDFGGMGKYVYEIELNLKANILFLTTKKEVFSFSKKYVRKDWMYSRFSSVHIEWERVREDYDGIEVNPYFRELRLSHNLIWYYGWDVPSGCIWKASAKKRITLISKYNQREKEFVIL